MPLEAATLCSRAWVISSSWVATHRRGRAGPASSGSAGSGPTALVAAGSRPQRSTIHLHRAWSRSGGEWLGHVRDCCDPAAQPLGWLPPPGPSHRNSRAGRAESSAPRRCKLLYKVGSRGRPAAFAAAAACRLSNLWHPPLPQPAGSRALAPDNQVQNHGAGGAAGRARAAAGDGRLGARAVWCVAWRVAPEARWQLR